jgi:hypothetical protein
MQCSTMLQSVMTCGYEYCVIVCCHGGVVVVLGDGGITQLTPAT